MDGPLPILSEPVGQHQPTNHRAPGGVQGIRDEGSRDVQANDAPKKHGDRDDPSDQAGKTTLSRVFDIELQMAQPSSVAVFGERAHVRFDLGPAPLAWQWYMRLRQLFLERLSV